MKEEYKNMWVNGFVLGTEIPIYETDKKEYKDRPKDEYKTYP